MSLTLEISFFSDSQALIAFSKYLFVIRQNSMAQPSRHIHPISARQCLMYCVLFTVKYALHLDD